MPNPYHVPRTRITLYFRTAEVPLSPRNALTVTTLALEKMFLVCLQAAKDRIPDPKVPVNGITVLWRSVVLGMIPNPANPDRFQATFAREALEGIIQFCVEEGWGKRTVEIHHDVLGYIANVVYQEHVG